MKYNAVRERLISVRLRGTFIDTASSYIYAPTGGTEQEKLDEFYEQSNAEINRTCYPDVLIAMGDCDEEVAYNEEDPAIRKYGLSNRNKTDRILQDKQSVHFQTSSFGNISDDCTQRLLK